MALIKRLSRLFAADMHAVLDQLEEPQAVLRQSVREMQDELRRQEQRSRWLLGEIETASARVEALEAATLELDAKLDTCFEHHNDELARKLTRRKLETLALAARAIAKRDALAKQRTEIEAVIATNRDQLDSLQQKVELLAIERPSPVGSADDERFGGIDDAEVEIAFLREKQARLPS